jgi:uncharacterized protein
VIELPVLNQPTVAVNNLMLYITEDCNLRCTYCFVKKTPRAMTIETARKSLDYLVQKSISGAQRLVNVTLFGGEPMLRTDLIADLIQYSRRFPTKTIHFGAVTNGTLAGPRVEKVVKEGRIQLLISLDGDREISRARPTVRGAESYAMVAKNLRRLVEWSPGAAVRMTYTAKTLDLVRSVKHALELGAPWIVLCPATDSGWAGQEQPVEDAHTALGEWFISEIEQERVPPLDVTWRMLRQYRIGQRTGLRLEKPCPVGAELISIDPDGNVMPCHRHLYRPNDWLGTIEDRALPARRSRYTEIRSSQIPDCASCEAKLVCGGGCRVVALEAGYGLHGAHPDHCLLTRAHHRMVERIHRSLAQNPLYLQCLNKANRLGSALQELARSDN